MMLIRSKRFWALIVTILLAVAWTTFWIINLKEAREQHDAAMINQAVYLATEEISGVNQSLKKQIQDLTAQTSELQKQLDQSKQELGKMQESLKALGVARDFQ